MTERGNNSGQRTRKSANPKPGYSITHVKRNRSCQMDAKRGCGTFSRAALLACSWSEYIKTQAFKSRRTQFLLLIIGHCILHSTLSTFHVRWQFRNQTANWQWLKSHCSNARVYRLWRIQFWMLVGIIPGSSNWSLGSLRFCYQFQLHLHFTLEEKND